MIKAVVFDFDGVIIESASIKTSAFRKLFELEYPEKADEIVSYHLKNMGISRYIKFRFICKSILKIPLSEGQEKLLGEKFSEIVFDEILKAPFVPGALEFLNENYRNFDLFVASGTPFLELLEIIKRRKLNHYFKEIYGSPETKDGIILEILNKYGYARSEMVFIGDAESDRMATQKNKINFIARITEENLSQLSDCGCKINDLHNLPMVLDKISKEKLQPISMFRMMRTDHPVPNFIMRVIYVSFSILVLLLYSIVVVIEYSHSGKVARGLKKIRTELARQK